MRTALEIVQSACLKLGLDQPDMLFASTERTVQELIVILNEASKRIVEAHEWTKLKVLSTYTGDAVTDAFDLPADYDRMPVDGRVWSTRTLYPMIAIESDDDWLRLQVRQFQIVIGSWIILGGQMHFKPPLYSSEQAKFYYVSNRIVAGASGNQEEFAADTDTFRLNDRILELGLIWEYRQRKGLPYAEDMQTYEIALAKEITKDKGARIIGQRSRLEMGAKIAYPGTIAP